MKITVKEIGGKPKQVTLIGVNSNLGIGWSTIKKGNHFELRSGIPNWIVDKITVANGVRVFEISPL